MPYNNPAGLIASAVILQLLVFSCVSVRLASRRKLKQRLLISDWLIIAATIFGLGLTVIQIYGCAIKAFGVPLDTNIQDPRSVTGRLNKAKHLELSYLLLGILTLGTIKVSVSFFYYHIFDAPVFRRIIILWICVLVAWTASFVIAGLLECGHHLLALFSTPTAYLQRCGNAIPTGWAMVGTDVATDVITLVLPIPMIWSLHMPLHRKILVALTFMIGLLSIGAAIAKAYIYITVSLAIYKADAILILTAFGTWNYIEVQIGIMAACGPTMLPILKEVVPREGLISLLDSLRDHLSRSGSASSGFSSGSTSRYQKYQKRNDSDSNSSFTQDQKNRSVVSDIRVGASSAALREDSVQDIGLERIHVRREVDMNSAEQVV